MPSDVFTPDMGDDATDINQQFLSADEQFKAVFINVIGKKEGLLEKIGNYYEGFTKEQLKARTALLQLNKSLEQLKSNILGWAKDPENEHIAEDYRDPESCDNR